MRGYVIFIFLFGMMGAVLGQCGGRSSTRVPAHIQQSFDDEQAQIAELKAKNSPQFDVGEGAVQLERQPDGHFYADVRINGATVNMLVDTGASAIALSREDAQMAGIATSIGMNGVVGEGADGPVHGEFARLESVELGPLSASGLDAVILNSGTKSLLGQSFLSKFASVQIEGDRMVLRQ